MKESDCDKTQIFYPKTKRCIKKDTKKAIEFLFNNEDKTIKKLYEMVNGKIIKKCEKPKVRNPDTKRCVKPTAKILTEIKKSLKPTNILLTKAKKSVKKPASLNTKINAIKKARKALSPFINRVSADIYHRNKYLILMRRELKNKREGCIKVYKQNPDKTYSYRIGNRIILKKRIGTDSVYGIVYLSEFREKEKKIFTYASKVYEYVEKKAKMELELLNKMAELVRMDMCPHFPLLYGYVICDNVGKFPIDSYEKTNKKDKNVSQKLIKFPELIRRNINSKIITTFNELANGDLWNYIEKYETDNVFIVNALIQILLSIMFFNYHMNRIHMDSHPGNFLYHKVKAGGYFHYELFGENYYLENIGILWVIWDFDLSKTLDEAMEIYKVKRQTNDYFRIIKAFLHPKYNGYCRNVYVCNNTSIIDFALKISNHNQFFFNPTDIMKQLFGKAEGYSKKTLKEYILKLPEILSDNKLDNRYILLKKLPEGAKVINKNPYKMTKDNLFN